MDLEEQKPNGVLENEIKKETEDVLEEIKKEPLEEVALNLKEILEMSSTSLLPTQNDDITENQNINVKNSKRKIARSSTNTKSKRRLPFLQCSVCSGTQIRQKVKNATIDAEKLVIVVGCILRGKYTLEKAREVMFEKENIKVCHMHFSETFCKLFDVNLSENRYSIDVHSLESIEMFMPTVNALIPQLMPCHFHAILNVFATRNKHILEMTDPFREELKESESRDLDDIEIKQETETLSETVKEEPLNEECSKQQIVPKLEEFIEPDQLIPTENSCRISQIGPEEPNDSK